MEPQTVEDVEEEDDCRRSSLKTRMRLRLQRRQHLHPVTPSPVAEDEDELRRRGGLREVEEARRDM